MSKPSKPSCTGACLQGNVRLLSARLFAMGSGCRRGPSSRGQSATATRGTGHTHRRLGPRGPLLRTGDPGSWFGATLCAEIARNPEDDLRRGTSSALLQGRSHLGLDPECTVRAAWRHRHTSPPLLLWHQNINTHTHTRALCEEQIIHTLILYYITHVTLHYHGVTFVHVLVKDVKI